MSRAHGALWRALLGAVLLAGVVWLTNPAQVWAQLRLVDMSWLLLGLSTAVASNVVSALRWRILARWLDLGLGPINALRWYFQAIGLNTLLPGAVVGGDVYRVWMLRANGASVSAASLVVIFDRISGLWILCALGGVGAVLCAPTLAPWLGWSTSGFVLLVLLATAAWLALAYMLPRLPVNRMPRRLGALHVIFQKHDYIQQLNMQALLSTAVQLLSAAALAAGALALGVRQPPAVWIFVSAPIFLMAALPVSVGGWGTREAAAVAALAPFAVAPATAVGVGLIYGVYALAQGALGALAFGLPRHR